jgi:hypothetical protein
MHWQEIYVAEKLRELEQLDAKRHQPFVEPPRRPKPVVGPVALRAGRMLRRFGEGLESWGAPPGAERPRGVQYR